jgi:hypothetical protein
MRVGEVLRLAGREAGEIACASGGVGRRRG